jgi:hypothetical protein
MSRFIAFTAVVFSSLLFVAGNVEAGCRSRGSWGWSRTPAYQPYYYAPAPSTTAGTGSTYRSYSYDPGAPQATYRYYTPPRDSGSDSYNQFRADRKIRGNYR